MHIIAEVDILNSENQSCTHPLKMFIQKSTYGVSTVTVDQCIICGRLFRSITTGAATKEGLVYNCNKKGDYEVGAITFINQTPLDLIKSKIKDGNILLKTKTSSWYTIIPDQPGLTEYFDKV